MGNTRRNGIILLLLLLLCFLQVEVVASDNYWSLRPFWGSATVKNESVLFRSVGDSVAKANLAFKIDSVQEIKSPYTGEVYQDGIDYTFDKSSNAIYLTKNSKIPYKKASELIFDRTYSNEISIAKDKKHALLFSEGNVFHSFQVEVTYRHTDKWKGVVPAYAEKYLPKTIQKLLLDKKLFITLIGDSISDGANSSEYIRSRPFMPSYGKLVAYALRAAYGARIDFCNLSVPGRDSSWRLGAIDYVEPDLVIIAWGMNDASAGITPEVFENNIKQQMDEFRRKFNPDVEFIIVTNMPANPDWLHAKGKWYSEYRDVIMSMAQDGVAVADVGGIWNELLKRKKFTDFTGNGLNHPNDFGHRIYAQAILTLLVQDTSKLDQAVVKDRDYFLKQFEQTEFIRDPHFRKGFNVLAPSPACDGTTKASIAGQLNAKADEEVVWELAQWDSKFSIIDHRVKYFPSGSVEYSNVAKSLVIGEPNSPEADIILGLNSVPEYDNKLRVKGQPWPHLLVSQPIINCPRISEMKAFELNISARVIQSITYKIEGYTPVLHVAHITFVLVINNVNESSAGYGDYMWFVVPVYDDRYEFARRWVEADIVEAAAKMIYDPGALEYTHESLNNGDWVTINTDILPVMKDALTAAWDRGYLKDSKDISDYGITSIHLIWEVTGLNDVKVQIKDISLKAFH